jgi:HD superfamily phosphodiesterase
MVIYTAALMHDIGDGKYAKESADPTSADPSRFGRERWIIEEFLKLLDLPPHVAITL